MTYLKQCQEAETEFREAMVALVRDLPAILSMVPVVLSEI